MKLLVNIENSFAYQAIAIFTQKFNTFDIAVNESYNRLRALAESATTAAVSNNVLSRSLKSRAVNLTEKGLGQARAVILCEVYIVKRLGQRIV